MQEDVEVQLIWLQEALDDEAERRQQEEQQEQQEQGQQQQQDGKPPLVPDVAELKLLRRLEAEVLEQIAQELDLHPELADPEAELHPLLLEDLTRLAYRHRRVLELFTMFREKLGVPAPEGLGQDDDSPPEDAEAAEEPLEEAGESPEPAPEQANPGGNASEEEE